MIMNGKELKELLEKGYAVNVKQYDGLYVLLRPISKDRTLWNKFLHDFIEYKIEIDGTEIFAEAIRSI